MVKRIAVINDLSGMGKCSLTAAIPVISVMGVQACPLPTAVLSNQTGYDSYYCDDYTKHMDAYVEEWKKRNITFDGIYTGYLGSDAQVEKIFRFLEHFRKPETFLLVDPVMGDGGEPYDVFTPFLREQMRKLAFCADVITPNLTEFCMLTDTSYEELTARSDEPDFLEQISLAGHSLLENGIQTIIVTGISYDRKLYNLVIEKSGTHAVASEVHGGSYSGTGDLLASVVSAGMVQGKSALECVKLAAKFLETALLETVNEQIPRNDGINFEPYLGMLLK